MHALNAPGGLGARLAAAGHRHPYTTTPLVHGIFLADRALNETAEAVLALDGIADPGQIELEALGRLRRVGGAVAGGVKSFEELGLGPVLLSPVMARLFIVPHIAAPKYLSSAAVLAALATLPFGSLDTPEGPTAVWRSVYASAAEAEGIPFEEVALPRRFPSLIHTRLTLNNLKHGLVQRAASSAAVAARAAAAAEVKQLEAEQKRDTALAAERNTATAAAAAETQQARAALLIDLSGHLTKAQAKAARQRNKSLPKVQRDAANSALEERLEQERRLVSLSALYSGRRPVAPVAELTSQEESDSDDGEGEGRGVHTAGVAAATSTAFDDGLRGDGDASGTRERGWEGGRRCAGRCGGVDGTMLRDLQRLLVAMPQPLQDGGRDGGGGGGDSGPALSAARAAVTRYFGAGSAEDVHPALDRDGAGAGTLYSDAQDAMDAESGGGSEDTQGSRAVAYAAVVDASISVIHAYSSSSSSASLSNLLDAQPLAALADVPLLEDAAAWLCWDLTFAPLHGSLPTFLSSPTTAAAAEAAGLRLIEGPRGVFVRVAGRDASSSSRLLHAVAARDAAAAAGVLAGFVAFAPSPAEALRHATGLLATSLAGGGGAPSDALVLMMMTTRVEGWAVWKPARWPQTACTSCCACCRFCPPPSGRPAGPALYSPQCLRDWRHP